MLDSLFTPTETQPIGAALSRLLTHNLHCFALTGSIALYAQSNNHTLNMPRVFGDVDIVIETIDDLPTSILDEFICLHVHPTGKKGDLLLQLANKQDAVRFDIFKAIGGALLRARPFPLKSKKVLVLSCEDLAARIASLLMKLERGVSLPSKHAEDFMSLTSLISDEAIEPVWQDYRNESDPPTFKEAAFRIKRLIKANPELLISPLYSKDIATQCHKCQSIGPFKPADRKDVFSILGYV